MENQICFRTDDGEEVLFTVLEQTRMSNVNYLLVADRDTEDAECLILKDLSKDSDGEAVYEVVEDEDLISALLPVFQELLGDDTKIEE